VDDIAKIPDIVKQLKMRISDLESASTSLSTDNQLIKSRIEYYEGVEQKLMHSMVIMGKDGANIQSSLDSLVNEYQEMKSRLSLMVSVPPNIPPLILLGK
jgi:argininosuccinate lyase